jgi:hypothetical protein
LRGAHENVETSNGMASSQGKEQEWKKAGERMYEGFLSQGFVLAETQVFVPKLLNLWQTLQLNINHNLCQKGFVALCSDIWQKISIELCGLDTFARK